MMAEPTVIRFEEALEDDDWGLIISKDGTLKGMFVPEGSEEEEVPEAIVQICKNYFGTDPTAQVTLH